MNAVTTFKALSDETRLRLVHLSLHYELNVNEIVSIMRMGQSRISRHLKILTDNKLLTFRRDGLWTFYSAVTEGEGYAFIQAIKYLFDTDSQFGNDLISAKEVLKAREIETVRFFDSIAEDWEKLKREIIGDTDINQMILNTIFTSSIKNKETIVDLGCGTGDLLEFLKKEAQLLIGVEKSSRMLDGARKRFASDGQNINLRIGELEHLPLREGEADVAVINMVLHHLPEPSKALKEVHRILKNNGTFIIADFLSHELESMRERFGDRWLGFHTEDIRKWLEASGFQVKKTDYFDLKKGLKGFILSSERI